MGFTKNTNRIGCGRISTSGSHFLILTLKFESPCENLVLNDLIELVEASNITSPILIFLIAFGTATVF